MATSAAGDASETPVLGERKASSSRAMVEDTTIGACWVCQHVSFPAALPTGVLLPNSSQSDWSVSGCENDATSCWRSRLRRVMKLLKLTAVCESVARRSWRSGIKPITTATATFRAQPLFLRSHNPNRLGRSVRICILNRISQSGRPAINCVVPVEPEAPEVPPLPPASRCTAQYPDAGESGSKLTHLALPHLQP